MSFQAMTDDHTRVNPRSVLVGSSSASSQPNSIQPTSIATLEMFNDFQSTVFQHSSAPGVTRPTDSQHSSRERADPSTSSRQSFMSMAGPPNAQKEACEFIKLVKNATRDNTWIFEQFSRILDSRVKHRITDAQMIQRVLDLFQDHPGLLEGFTIFLPGYDVRITERPTAIRLRDGNGRKMYFHPRRLDIRHFMADTATASSPATDSIQPPPPPREHTSTASRPQPAAAEGYTPTSTTGQPGAPQTSARATVTVTANGSTLATGRPPATPVSSESPSTPIQSISKESQTLPDQRTHQSSVSEELSRVLREKRQSHPALFSGLVDLVSHVKMRFADQPDRYLAFIRTIQESNTSAESTRKVVESLSQLVRDQPDLLDQLQHFFPTTRGSRTDYLVRSATENTDGESHQPERHRSSHAAESVPEGASATDIEATLGLGSAATKSVSRPPRVYSDDWTPNTSLLQEEETDYDSDSDSVDSDDFPVSLITMEDIEMFGLVRRHIKQNNRSHKEFLKLLTLYVDGIFDADLIVEHVEPFIGDDPFLFQWFKSLVNYQSRVNEVVHRPSLVPKPALYNCETVLDSPSYRRVPIEWQQQPCSGRDDLCREVLNDNYVSYPRWTREDSDFPASKKSNYEEEMHECEEARYSFDTVLDANQSAIATLELLIRSPPAEPVVLDPITLISIRHVYGSQRTREIEKLMQKHFVEIAPTVLERLIQKGREWKQAQYELIPVWRERDAKNYYRALDYKGITFRAADRKTIAPKTMLSEIQTLSEKGSGYTFSFPDLDVLQDVAHLCLIHASQQLSTGERHTIQLFFQEILPFIFQIDCSHIHVPVTGHLPLPESMTGDDDFLDFLDAGSPLSEERSGSPPIREYGPQSAQPEYNGRPGRDRTNSNKLVPDELLKGLGTPTRLRQFRFLCDTTFYCFFRVFQLVYERLIKLKQLDVPRKPNSVAVRLGLYGDRTPEIVSPMSYYSRMLVLVEDLFMGNINHAKFEERLRLLYITQAYPLFTIDRVVSNLTKSILMLTMDPSAVNIVHLFSKDTARNYQTQGTKTVGPGESLFDINVNIDTRELTMKVASRRKD